MTRPTVGLPFLPWYPARFMSATRGWSITARGVYRELLDCQWEMGSLPPTPAELQQLIGATVAEWRCWPTLVEPKFPLDPDNKRRNPTLEEHRKASLSIRERNRAGAAKTNAARWGTNVVQLPAGRARSDS